MWPRGPGPAEPAALHTQVVEAMAPCTEFFVDLMMLEELQMAPPPELSALQAAGKVGSGVLVCGGMLPLCYALFCLSRPGPAAFALALGVAMAGRCSMARAPSWRCLRPPPSACRPRRLPLLTQGFGPGLLRALRSSALRLQGQHVVSRPLRPPW